MKSGISIPAPKEGLIYKDMGIQENQNCTVITLRMKHRRMRWSVNGANNMAKALYRKENRELIKNDRPLIIQTLEQDELFLRADRIEIPASITAVEFYKKQGYDYKNGVNELDDEGYYRLEKFNVKKR